MKNILMFGALILSLAACETVQGAGKDLQKAGATVTDEARKAEAGM